MQELPLRVTCDDNDLQAGLSDRLFTHVNCLLSGTSQPRPFVRIASTRGTIVCLFQLEIKRATGIVEESLNADEEVLELMSPLYTNAQVFNMSMVITWWE